MATGLSLQTRLEITGDRTMFERASGALRNPRKLLRQVGVLGMSSAVRRLPDVLKKEGSDAVRTGALAASLRAGMSGAGGGDTIFDLSDARVEVGTNLTYAAQVHHGGVIQPREQKTLAIPLPTALKRSRQWPKDLDKNREILQFVPYTGSRPNIIGLLVDPEGKLGYGKGPLYALAYYVIQEPRPFLFWSDEDVRIINDELWPAFLGVK